MRNVNMICLAVLLTIACAFAGITGKISGKVVDAQSQDPMPGANVFIEGTTLGAATDMDGRFIILNVPVGSYTLKSTYMGYHDYAIEQLHVNADLTTEANFDMVMETIEVESISIVAERPLVNKNATNTTRIQTADDIAVMPIRGFRQVVGIQSGVTTVGNRIYVRGGRREEIATYVDGVYQNNPLTGRAAGDLSNNAIQEVSFQAGGFNAEYGFANSGVIQTFTKTGADRLKIAGEVVTDEFLSKTDKFLDTYSYGYNIYNFSIGGPLTPNKKIKFHLGAERRFQQDRNPSAFAYQNLKMDADGNPLAADGTAITFADTSSAAQYGWNVEDAFPGTDGEYKLYQWDEQGIWPNRQAGQWLWNGNLTFDLNPINIRIGGNSQRIVGQDLAGFTPGADLKNTLNGSGIGFSLWNSANNPRDEQAIDSYYLKVTHTLGPKTFYTAQLNYFRDFTKTSSPTFGDAFWNIGDAPGTDIGQYGTDGDGITNEYISQTGTRPHMEPRSADMFSSFGTQQPRYTKTDWQFIGLKADFVHQIGTVHEVKAGVEYRYNTYRNYDIGGYGAADLHSLAQSLASVGPNLTPEQAYQVRFVDNFGYDVFGNKSDDDERNAAKHPQFGAIYLQDKIELEDLVLNIGLRYDYFTPNVDRMVDLEHVSTEILDNGLVDLTEENYVETEAWTNLSPRLGFSFPVTDRTVLHAQYGKFVQTPELRRLYSSSLAYAYSLQSGNFFRQQNPNLGPVYTTSYEVGFQQQLSNFAALDVTAYYKEINDHVRLINLDYAEPVPYAIYQNQDYGTVKGLAFALTLRRFQRMTANVNYTLQWAAGTGSDALTFDNIVWMSGQIPTYVAPLDYDQRHSANISVDYRFGDKDGPSLFGKKVLQNSGLNLLFNVGSGLSYTPIQKKSEVFGGNTEDFPLAQIGSAYGPWSHQLDLKLDKTFTVGDFQLNAYLLVVNLTDALNANFVYPATGEADNDGYFDTPAGKSFINNWGENGKALYQFLLRNPDMVSAPRQIRFGLKFFM